MTAQMKNFVCPLFARSFQVKDTSFWNWGKFPPTFYHLKIKTFQFFFAPFFFRTNQNGGKFNMEDILQKFSRFFICYSPNAIQKSKECCHSRKSKWRLSLKW
jgi:hypothetical protein